LYRNTFERKTKTKESFEKKNQSLTEDSFSGSVPEVRCEIKKVFGSPKLKGYGKI